MPWKLIPPREGKTPFWYVRGTFLGITLDRSTQSRDKRSAATVLNTWSKQAKRGEFQDPHEQPSARVATFLSASIAYTKAGGEQKYTAPILDAWGEKPLSEIDQVAIDTLAAQLYPGAPASTRNRQVYTPVSAILKHVGIERKIKRPKGWRGKKSISWLEPEQVMALFAAADGIEPEFGLFLRMLFYTGMRLSEALGITIRHLNLDRSEVYLPETKNGEARMVHLPPDLVAALANHPRGLDRPGDAKLIRYHVSGSLRAKLKLAMEQCGLRFPRRQGGFHIFCHTYGTLMARLGADLLETGRWKDRKSSDLYVHLDAKSEARKADALLMAKGGNVIKMKVG